MTETTTADAAARLGVSQRQVQRLIAAGELSGRRTAGDAWLLDALAVNALARSRPGRGRPWEAATAWGALWLLSGLDAPWLDSRTRSRLAERLRDIDAEELVQVCRRRAVLVRCRVSESFVDDLRAALVLSDGGTVDLAVSSGVEGYCDEPAWSALCSRLHMVADPRGNATVRVTSFSTVLHGRAAMPEAVVAVDLAESYETRERAAGLRALGRLLR
ncbi:MAG: hypothetical protein FWE61_03235 [Micrococcales bacterium]|nr:hypothetical protein [Micrococcales bacterium]